MTPRRPKKTDEEVTSAPVDPVPPPITDKDLLLICEIAEDIYRTLESGLSEDIYQKAIEVGLRAKHIKYDAQRKIELTYLDHFVGIGIPDLIVRFGEKKVAVELKAVKDELGYGEQQQLLNYMKILGIESGLLINFQCPGKSLSGEQVQLQRQVLRLSL
jgi:GxxExxY protein